MPATRPAPPRPDRRPRKSTVASSKGFLKWPFGYPRYLLIDLHHSAFAMKVPRKQGRKIEWGNSRCAEKSTVNKVFQNRRLLHESGSDEAGGTQVVRMARNVPKARFLSSIIPREKGWQIVLRAMEKLPRMLKSLHCRDLACALRWMPFSNGSQNRAVGQARRPSYVRRHEKRRT